MPGIRVREGQTIEIVLKIFKRQIERAGVITEVRNRQAFEKPTEKAKRKSLAAKKRLLKQIRRTRQYS